MPLVLVLVLSPLLSQLLPLPPPVPKCSGCDTIGGDGSGIAAGAAAAGAGAGAN